jgi:uncharacterized protein
LTTPGERRDAVRSLHGEAAGLLTRRSVFELVADDIVWEAIGSPEQLPWAGLFRGREALADWFATLDSYMEYERFEPLEFFAEDETVIEIVFAAGWARQTGIPFESEVVRIWTFRGDRVVHVRSYYDTGAYERALAPAGRAVR